MFKSNILANFSAFYSSLISLRNNLMKRRGSLARLLATCSHLHLLLTTSEPFFRLGQIKVMATAITNQ